MLTGLYAALLAIFFVFLSVYVIRGRFQHKLSLGHGEIPDMVARTRAHGNFSEYVPISLILMFFLEFGGSSHAMIHALGLMLVLGRALHAIALLKLFPVPYARQAGMALTFTMILISAILLLLK